MKIALETLGCKLNQAETESLSRQLVEAGHSLVSSVQEADVYILNTCTVTHTADAKSRHLLRLAHRKNPEARLIATGCYAQLKSQELSRIEGVSLVVSNDDKSSLPFLLEEMGCPGGFCSIPEESESKDGFTSRTRAFIKIQDGCNKRCTYCIVPLVRGEEKSQQADEIITEIKERVDAGVKEVVLTGTEVGAYDDKGIGLKKLLERVLNETEISRIRLSSLQPLEITQELIELWSNGRLCPHFHISLQSGSDKVLRQMKRRYSTAEYRSAVSLIRAIIPDVSITTDIITGFPGETDGDFEESREMCGKMGFARIHVFPYSPRLGTPAAVMPAQVKEDVKKQRTQELLEIAEENARKFNQRFLGRILPVLWEHGAAGVWPGHTDNYIEVSIRSNDDLTNRLLRVKLTGIRGDGMWGEIEETSGAVLK